MSAGTADSSTPATWHEYVFAAADSGGTAPARVWVSEELSEEYGAYVWPCAAALAAYVWASDGTPPSAVLELGCGVALPGLAAAARYDHAAVTLTDTPSEHAWEAALDRTLQRNRFGARVAKEYLRWGDRAAVDALAADPGGRLPYTLILAADCLFDTEVLDPFLYSLSLVLHRCPTAARALVAYQRRDDSNDLDRLFAKWCLRAVRVCADPTVLIRTALHSGKVPEGVDAVALWRVSLIRSESATPARRALQVVKRKRKKRYIRRAVSKYMRTDCR